MNPFLMDKQFRVYQIRHRHACGDFCQGVEKCELAFNIEMIHAYNRVLGDIAEHLLDCPQHAEQSHDFDGRPVPANGLCLKCEQDNYTIEPKPCKSCGRGIPLIMDGITRA